MLPSYSFVTDFVRIFRVAYAVDGFTDDACRCKGCGCKGGSGWRGPDGFCVAQGKLAAVCGTPAGAPCKQENAPRICFGKQAAIDPPR